MVRRRDRRSMAEITILCPTGHLGFTPLEPASFHAGCELKPDFIELADDMDVEAADACRLRALDGGGGGEGFSISKLRHP